MFRPRWLLIDYQNQLQETPEPYFNIKNPKTYKKQHNNYKKTNKPAQNQQQTNQPRKSLAMCSVFIHFTDSAPSNTFANFKVNVLL